jgi:hypothetical protein
MSSPEPTAARRIWSALIAWGNIVRLSKLSDLALRLIGIVAAVGALNFFTLKPSLHVKVACETLIDVKYLEKRLAAEEKRYGSFVAFKRPDAVSELIKEGGAVQVVRPRVGPPNSRWFPQLETALASAVIPPCAPIPADVYRDALSRATPALKGGSPAENGIVLAAGSLAQSTFLRMRTSVANNGDGGAKNVRVQPPVGFRATSAAPAGITLRPGEKSGRIDFRGEVVGENSDLGGADTGPLFRTFGDDVPDVDRRTLLLVTLGLFLFFFVPALIAEIVHGGQAHNGS